MPEAPDSRSPVITMEGVSFGYAHSGDWVIEDVSFEVRPREFVGLIGPNGGGKTTLLRIMLGLLEPTRGRVTLLGDHPRRTRHRVGYVPQRAALDTQTPATVLDLVLMGLLYRSRFGPWFTARHREAARTALDRVGIPHLAHRPLEALSGGQRQRALIARALVGDAELLLLDEPVTGIDPRAEAGLVELLNDLRKSLPIVLVSHDIGFVHQHIDRVACLNRTLVVHRTDEVTTDHIDHLYRDSMVHVHHHDPACAVHGHAVSAAGRDDRGSGV